MQITKEKLNYQRISDYKCNIAINIVLLWEFKKKYLILSKECFMHNEWWSWTCLQRKDFNSIFYLNIPEVCVINGTHFDRRQTMMHKFKIQCLHACIHMLYVLVNNRQHWGQAAFHRRLCIVQCTLIMNGKWWMAIVSNI